MTIRVGDTVRWEARADEPAGAGTVVAVARGYLPDGGGIDTRTKTGRSYLVRSSTFYEGDNMWLKWLRNVEPYEPE